jgi:hypothetical protein
MVFNRFNCRKIDTAFTVAAAAFFGKQIFVNKPANVKHGCGKNYGYYNYLDIHVTNLIHFIHIRIDKRNSIWFEESQKPGIKN